MQSKFVALITILFLAMCTTNAQGEIAFNNGYLNTKCGGNNVTVSYRVSLDSEMAGETKFAILIDGSPVTKFFSDNKPNYLKIVQGLWQSGYHVFEIKYPSPDGFYDACLHQGLDNVIDHSASIYDHAKKILGFNPDRPEHRLVGLGSSIGAVLLQNMAFTKGKEFNAIALTGVLLGNAEQGCRQGIEVLAMTEKRIASSIVSLNNIFDGMSWASFMNYVQKISSSGQGCCLENSSGFGACAKGVRNEYTSRYNFDQQPFFASSTLAMFEGKITKPEGINVTNFSSANPAQVNYIAEHRKKAGAPTQVFFYEQCDHSVINCSRSKAVDDILNFLIGKNNCNR